MGKGSTTQNTAPWAEAQPFYKDIFNQAQSIFQATPQKSYTGDMIAQPTAADKTGIDLAKQTAAALNLMNPSANTQSTADYISGKVNSGAYGKLGQTAFTGIGDGSQAEATIQAAINPVKKQLQMELLPQMSSAAINAGAYGGSALEKLQARAADQYMQTAGDISTKLLYDDYTKRRQMSYDDFNAIRNNELTAAGLEQSGANLVPALSKSAVDLALLPSSIYSSIGETERALNQLGIDNELKKFEFGTQSPYAYLQPYAQLVTGTGSGFSTTTGKTKTSLFDDILKAGMGGAALYLGA